MGLGGRRHLRFQRLNVQREVRRDLPCCELTPENDRQDSFEWFDPFRCEVNSAVLLDQLGQKCLTVPDLPLTRMVDRLQSPGRMDLLLDTLGIKHVIRNQV